MKNKLQVLLVSTVTTVALGLPALSLAVPAWARKYELSCGSCHVGGTNKLTLMGLKFQRRGYRMTDDEPMKDSKGVSLGNYLSFASKFRYEAEKDANPSTKFDVEALSIYSGGPIQDKYSYFFEIYLHERGKDATSTGGQLDTATRSKLAEAYLQYTSRSDSDDYTFFRAGQYTPRIIYHASTGGRFSVNRPLVWNDNVGGGNLYTPRDRFYGATAGVSTSKGMFAEVGVTNGGGGNARPNIAEQNNAKDWFGSISQQLDENGSQIGFYAYKGFYPVTSPTAYTDEFTRYALLADYVLDRFSISGAYSFGENKNLDGSKRNPKGLYLEGGFNVNDDSSLFLRYDNYDYDLAPRKTGYTLGWSRRMGSVGRYVVEYSDIKPTGGAAARKLTFEINWLF